MSAAAAAERIAAGLRRALPQAQIECVPIADGGDGTARAVVAATNGRWVECKARDPLGRVITSGFGLTGDGRAAVIEMALASGLALLAPSERNPLLTTTHGTGDLIKAALALGAKRIILGIGGSATNDGGLGMAMALGARFLDAAGAPLKGCGGDLPYLARIDFSGLDPRLADVKVQVACDVTNPLYGAQGAAQVYAPQKGANRTVVALLDDGLRNLARVIERDLQRDVAQLPGAGAAGGLGAALTAFIGGTLQPGAELVLDICALDERLSGAYWVITAEGRLDGQTIYGKAPAAVARRAQKRGVPVIALGGCLGEDLAALREVGVSAWFATLSESISEAEIPLRGPAMLEACAEQVGRLIAAAQYNAERNTTA